VSSAKGWGKRGGFTIVELLIVIVVIAVLAAISTIAYTGIQQRARASVAQAEVSSVKKKLDVYRATYGMYPDSGNLAAAGVTSSSTVSYQYQGDGEEFCLTATVADVSYKISQNTIAQKGGCAGHGQGGVAPIRNLARDPKATGSSWFSPIVSGVTRSMNVSWAGKNNWSRFVWNGSGATTVRMMLELDDLTNGESYTSSFLVGNDGSQSVTFSMDLADAAPVPVFTVNPGEQKRVSFTASKSFYSSVYRFVDMNLQTSGGKGILITDGMVTQGSSEYAFAHGDSENWRWEGQSNNSTSVGPPL
jgi:prepilin-type N-terminal cleavage/methylation domain-containing protein